MSKLRYVPGQGFPGTIISDDGEMIGAVNMWGDAEREAYYGRLFAASEDMLDTIEQAIDALSGHAEWSSVLAWLEDVRVKATGGNHGRRARATDVGQSASY